MSFKDLDVWQRARKLAVLIYQLTEDFPKSEQFGLTSQMRRASVSVAANIAEGYGRKLKADFSRFLRIAKGSVNELETLLIISGDLGFLKCDEELSGDLSKIGSMLTNLISKIEEDSRTVKEDFGLYELERSTIHQD